MIESYAIKQQLKIKLKNYTGTKITNISLAIIDSINNTLLPHKFKFRLNEKKKMQQDSLFPVRAQTHEHKIGQTNQDKRIKIKTNKKYTYLTKFLERRTFGSISSCYDAWSVRTVNRTSWHMMTSN